MNFDSEALAGEARRFLVAFDLRESAEDRLIRKFLRICKAAAGTADKEALERTRWTIDNLASSTRALELAGMEREFADALSERVARSLDLDRVVPAVDLMLALERAARDLRSSLFVKGRPANIPLRLATGLLLPVVEEATGHRTRIRGNKSRGEAPEGGNAAARLLIGLVQLALPGTTTTAVCNTITSLQKASVSSRGTRGKTAPP